jgi:alpha-ribazole phosphatase
MNRTLIDFIRHGEPVGGRRYRGRTDDPLSEKGFGQMWAAVGEFAGWQEIVTSPLSRCAGFAEALAERRGIPLQVDERLAELGYGEWEGKTPEELIAEDPDLLLRYRRDPLGNRPRGAEDLDHFAARVTEAWRDLVERAGGRHVLVVAHAGVIRMTMAHVLGIPLSSMFRIQVANAAVTRFAVEGQGADAFSSLIFHDGHVSG